MEPDPHFEFQHTEIYEKAMEIAQLGHYLSQLCKNPDLEHPELVEEYGFQIAADASMIPLKIAGAWDAELYDLKMENAVIIRKAARDIMAAAEVLKSMGIKETDYLELLCDALEEFRILFVEWVSTFDPFNYITDRWGLFNPPGTSYDDPDEDFPFDPDDDLPFGSDEDFPF